MRDSQPRPKPHNVRATMGTGAWCESIFRKLSKQLKFVSARTESASVKQWLRPGTKDISKQLHFSYQWEEFSSSVPYGFVWSKRK